MRPVLAITLLALAGAVAAGTAGAQARHAAHDGAPHGGAHDGRGDGERRCRIVEDDREVRDCTPEEERRARAAGEAARRTVERLQPQIEAAQEMARRHRSAD